MGPTMWNCHSYKSKMSNFGIFKCINLYISFPKFRLLFFSFPITLPPRIIYGCWPTSIAKLRIKSHFRKFTLLEGLVGKGHCSLTCPVGLFEYVKCAVWCSTLRDRRWPWAVSKQQMIVYRIPVHLILDMLSHSQHDIYHIIPARLRQRWLHN